MSSTKVDSINSLIGWLNRNAYWNDTCELKPSKFGLGVFQKQDSKLKKDDILLRVPKSNILSPKNAFIYNLIFDYTPQSTEINLMVGMHGLILAVIYELSLGDNSPWYEYLGSIDFCSEDGNIALCLWDDIAKSNLKNSEVDTLNMMNIEELVDFYYECITFARSNEHLVEEPEILHFKDPEILREDLVEKYKHKLVDFSKIIQSVISRAFLIDEFYDLSLVPGADLFNHLAPTLIENELQPNENVHFVCDSNTCAFCGEIDCDEHEEDVGGNDEDEENEDEIDEEHEDNENNEQVDNDEENEKLSDLDDDEDVNIEESEDESESESSVDEHNSCADGCHHSEHSEENDDDDDEPITEITMDYIAKLEKELEEDSDTDTMLDDEEVSTLSLSEEEGENNEGSNILVGDDGVDDELTRELMDNSKCCDIVLVSSPKKEHGYEIFNTYGNNLSNPYLLQRYGFISENNPNNSVLLSVQFFRYLKSMKSGLSQMKQNQIDKKIEWLEEVGFEILNEILFSPDEENEPDSSWELSMKVLFDRTVSVHTYAILNLVKLPWKYFKMLCGRSERRTMMNIQKYLLNYEEKDFKDIIKSWCNKKLAAYPKLKTSSHMDIITGIVQQETNIIKAYINSH